VNGVVALGTLAMAWYSRRMIVESRRSIEAALRSAQATEESAQRMKDGLMPQLALDISGATGGYALYVRNVGTGLARIRLVTIRTDVKIECAIGDPISYWDCRSDNPDLAKGKVRLIDFVIAAGDEFTFLLGSGQEFSRDSQHDYLSSVSLFYEDVYKRLYRTRLLYLHKSWGGTYEMRQVSTEHFSVDTLPVLPMSNFNIDLIRTPEGYTPHRYRPQFGVFSLLEHRNLFFGVPVAGNPFTQDKDIRVENIVIPWHGYPEFHLRIGGHTPFALVAVPKDEMGQLKYDVRNVPSNPDIWRGMEAPNESPPFSQCGLVAEGRDEPQIKDLYERIYKVLMGRISRGTRA